MNKSKLKDSSPATVDTTQQHWVITAFFFTGVAGLMHEVVWAKLLQPLIGATAYAQAIVLAVFMGGLTIGSVVFGHRVDVSKQPLKTYVILELLIGIYCLILPFLVQAAGYGYIHLAKDYFDQPTIKMVLRSVLTVSIILLPAVLMGGTLPLLARHLIRKLTDTQSQVGKLYAINSIGAVIGAGVSGFITLPLLGIFPSLVIASGLNFLAAFLVFRHAKGKAQQIATSELKLSTQKRNNKVITSQQPNSYRTSQYLVTMLALVMSGFAAMGYEVLFTRIIALSFGSSTYSFSVMLMSFITGISLGAAILSRYKIERPIWMLALSQFTVVVVFILVTPLIERLPYLIGLLRIDLHDVAFGFEFYQLGKGILCLAVLLIPTMCLGFSFPLVAQIWTSELQQVGSRVGSTYAWNTVGNVLGVVVTSLVLIPQFGILNAFHVNLSLNLLAGIALLCVAGNVTMIHKKMASAVVSFIVALYLVSGTEWSHSISQVRDHLRMRYGPETSLNQKQRAQHPATSFIAWQREYVVNRGDVDFFFFDQDAHASVMVSGVEENVQLSVNGKTDASSSVDLDTQLLLAHIPLFLAPEAHNLLVIGHGSGITAGSALRHPVKRADIVEISNAVMNADYMFASSNYHVLNDPRVHAFIDDGLSYLRSVPRNYDVIISEPSNPWIAGVSGLFTVEFFESVKSKLNPGGVFALWFHTYEQSDASVQLVLRTAASVFPQIMLFLDIDHGNVFAIASVETIKPDFAKMDKRFNDPLVANDLARLGISNLAGLLSHHRISQQNFSSILPEGPLNYLTRQRLEYAASRSLFLDEDSFFLEQFDPLVSGKNNTDDLLLDQYIAYRKASGMPMNRSEFLAAAEYVISMGGYGPAIAAGIGYRSIRATTQNQ